MRHQKEEDRSDRRRPDRPEPGHAGGHEGARRHRRPGHRRFRQPRQGQGPRPDGDGAARQLRRQHQRHGRLSRTSRARTSVIITAGKPRVAGMTREDLLATNIAIITDVAGGHQAIRAQGLLHRRHQSPRRHGLCLLQADRLPQAPGRRHGRDAGHGPLARLHRHGARRLRGRRRRHRPRRTRPRHGPAAPADHGRRRASRPRSRPRSRSTSSSSGPARPAPRSSSCSAGVRRSSAPPGARSSWPSPILKDKRRVLPAAALCEGEYGINGLFIGVPVLIGAKGLEKIFEIKLTDEENGHAPEDGRGRQEHGGRDQAVEDEAGFRNKSPQGEVRQWPNTESRRLSPTRSSTGCAPATRSSSAGTS